MADAVVSVVINAEDNASTAIGRVAQSLGALNAQGGNANIQTGKVNEGIKSIGDASEKASNQAKTLDKELTGLSKQSASISAQRISGGIKSIGDASEKASNQAKALDKELTSGSNAINKFNTVSSRLGRAGAKLESWGKATKDFGEGIDDATKPLQKASAGILAAGIATGKAAIDFENNFANVKKTVDGTPEQLEAVEEGLIALGTTGINGRNAIPATTRELTELAATAGQLGIKTENIVDFTEVMAQMGTATNLYGEQGAATLAKFANITGMSQSNFRNLGSSLVALGNNFATTEADIANMSMRLASAGTTVGMSEADILGLATTLSSTGMEAEAGGSAISTVMLNIQDAVTNGGDALEAYAKASGKTAEQFKEDWNNSAINTIMDLFDSLGESDNLAQSVNDLGITEIRQRDAVMRLANAHNQLREAVTMGNTAWQENTALQNEFDAKAETTASQIAVTKNNVVEAARSFGETMLPSIKNASEGIKDYAQELARMDDTQKESIINTAKNVVIAGAAAKGISTVIKGAGSVASGLGAIATAAGTTIAPVAGITAGVIALGAGLTYGITKYKEYQNAQRNWGDGAEEAAEKAHEAIEKVQEISGLQREMWDLRQIINNPDSTPEQLEAAKARIEEIAQLLAQEYNLTINVNTSDLDGAVSEVSSYLDTLGQMSVSELEMETGNLKIELGENYGRYAYHEETMSNLQKQWDDNSENAIKYSKAVGKIEGAYGALTRAEEVYKNTTGKEDFRETEEGARLITQAVNETDSALKELGENNATVETLADVEYWLGELEKNYNDYKGKATDAQVRMREEQAAYEKWIQSRERLSQAGITEATKGNTELGLANMKTAINDYGAAVEDVASDWALAQNGFNSFNEAIQSADKDNYVRDLVNNMQALGVQTEYAAAQGALAENGFKTMEQAAQAGGKALDNVARDFGEISLDKGLNLDKINEVAHSLNMIPEWKEITINAEGNVEVIDTVRKAAEDLSEHSDTKLRVTAEGNIEVLETADEKLKALAQAGLVTVKFNFDTGGWDIFSNENGEKIGEITVDGKVNWTTGEVEKPSEEETTAEGKTNFKKGEVEKPSEEETTVEGTINWKVKEIDTPDISGGTSTEGFIVDDWNSWSKGGNSITIEPEVNVNPKVAFNGETVQKGSFDLLEGLGLKSTTASAEEIESVDVPANVNVQAQSVNVESMPEATATEAQTVDVTANVKLHAGNIDFSEFSSYVGMGAQAAAGLTGAQEVNITANVKLHAGTIDYSELSSYIEMGAQAAAGLTGTQSVDVTANVVLHAGTINYSELSNAISLGAQAAAGLTGAQNVNATTNITLIAGTIDSSALSGAVTDAIAGITAQGTVEASVTFTVNSSAPDQYKPANKTAVATYTVNSSAPDQYKPANKTATAIYGLDSSAVDSYQPADKYATVHYTVSVEGAIPNAKGTQNFRGGLAMVNDQKGVSDPRELIIDQGRAFIPEGRDVILPLSNGARVFTASQTKAIMSGLGIPHFAGGYYPPEFQFLIGEDIREIVQRLYDEEYSTWMYGNDHMSMNGGQVVLALENTDFTGLSETEKESLIREKLDQKKKELEGSFANRWGLNFETEASYYNPTDAAIDRMNLSSELIANQEELLEGYIDLAEQEKSYGDVLSHTSTLIDTRLERVNALNQANAEMRNEMEYLQNSSGYEGIQSWTDELGNATEEYYAFLNSLSTQEEQDKAESYFNDIQKYQQKIIANTEEIRDLTNDISSMRLELNSQKFELWESDFENWTQMHEVYGDWEDVGDSLSQSYARAIERQREFFEAGIIGWQDYHDNVFEYSLEMYKAASDEYDEMLAEQSEYINKMQEEFSKQEEELRTSWDVEDRGADLYEVNRLLAIYDNSVTDTGRQKYKDLLEQKKQLEREEKLYQLQVRNNAVLEQLRTEYDVMEENKKAALSGLRMTGDDIASSNAYISDTADDIRSLAAAIGVQYSAAADSTLNTLEDIYQLLSSIKNVLGIRAGNSQTYNDSRTINVSSGLSENSVRAIINGTVLSGLADFIY